MGQQVQQFERGQLQFGATVDGRAAQAVDQGLFVETAKPLLTERRPCAVTCPPLEAVAVPIWKCHRGVDRPAAGVVTAVQDMEGVVVEVAVAVQPAQAAVAHLCLYRPDVFPFQIERRVENRLAALARAEHAVFHQHMQ